VKDAVYRKPTPAKSIAVPMLRKIGERLSSDERAPYEKVAHDDVFDMAQPTNPNLQALLRTDENEPT
jgi:hypothetical protein